jgi:uracil-DNA glycosylase
MTDIRLVDLLNDARNCQLCVGELPHSPRPVVRANVGARLLIIGQAPGMRVHASGVPWDDPSGDRLREWLGMSRDVFYDDSQVAIMPMGFCYPGRGRSGDLPPRPECGPRWHAEILACLPEIQLTLLIGRYAQHYYLADSSRTLTDTVKNWREHLPEYFALPHPSPRNYTWLARNLWFETDVLPELKRLTNTCLDQ